MPITCNPVLTAPTGGYMGSAPHGFAGPWFFNGNYYVINLVSDANPGTYVYRSADLAIWQTINVNGANSPGARPGGADCLAMVRIGNEIWVFLPKSNVIIPSEVGVWKYNLATEAWLAPVPGVLNIPVVSRPGNLRPIMVAAVRGPNVVLFYNGATSNRVYWSEFDGTQWIGAATILPVPNALWDYAAAGALTDSNGFLHFFVTAFNSTIVDMLDPARQQLYHVSLSPANAFGTTQLLTDYLNPRFTNTFSLAVRYISNAYESNGELRILVTRADGLPPNPFNPQPAIWTVVGTVAEDPVWAAATLVTTETDDPSQVNVNLGLVGAHIGTLDYAFWVKAVFADGLHPIYSVRYAGFSGGAWQAPADLVTFNDREIVSISIGLANGTSVMLFGNLGPFTPGYNEFFYSGALGTPISVACDAPPNGTVGSAYSHTFPASGGTAPYTFAIVAGALPNGLALNAATGAVSGTPTAPGTFNFDIQVTDSLGGTSTASCSITISAAIANPGGLPSGIQGCRPRNRWDWCMFFEFLLYSQIHFPPLCSLPKEFRNWLPWDEDFAANAVPPGAVPLHRVSGIVTPVPLAGDQTILETRIPVGYDGLLAGIFHFYSGNGFVQGSGDIVWRLQLNQRYLEDLGNVPYSLGSPQSPLPLTEGQILLSGQTLRYLVNVPNLSGLIQVGQSQITAGLIGFLWPR